jgi:CBS domain-containing protein
MDQLDAIRDTEPGKRFAVVADVMSWPVTTLSAESSIADAEAIFTGCGFRHIPVADAAGRIAGIVSDRDVLRATDQTATIGGIMTRPPITATPHMPIRDAIRLIIFHRFNCLPVVDGGGKVCGIVTTTDLLAALYAVMERPDAERILAGTR